MRTSHFLAGLTGAGFLLLAACMPGSDSTLQDTALAAQPAGWLGICERMSGDPYCRPLEFTPERLAQLRQVQAEVRASEGGNPALAAEARLQQRGWPAQALRVTAIATADGTPHRVLTVQGRSDGALVTYVLDSRFAAVHRLDELGYDAG